MSTGSRELDRAMYIYRYGNFAKLGAYIKKQLETRPKRRKTFNPALYQAMVKRAMRDVNEIS